MDDYKAKHHQRYLERQEDARKAEEEKKRRIKELEEQIDVCIDLIKESKTMNEVETILHMIEKKLNNYENQYEKGLAILEALNSNTYIMVNTTNIHDLEASVRMQTQTQKILKLCGLDVGDIGLEYSMDCSKDEEIARELADI